jgi:crotonobetainyl-CoA:carnitine CoA-transferase CaiB-like acyl-CoA transferase
LTRAAAVSVFVNGTLFVEESQVRTRQGMENEVSEGHALAGLRVLDLGRLFAAPWAGQLLGDLGADVIKVERVHAGDEMREYGPPFLDSPGVPGSRESAYSLAANRNKRSIALDLRKPQGAQIVRQLAAKADVVIENFKAGDLRRYGLDHESLRAVSPSLIYCSITGFGQTGPYAAVPATDSIFQAMSGLMSVTGEPDGEPQRVGVVIVDLLTGVYAATAILAALRHRDRTGRGQHIDLALLDVAMAAMSHRATEFLMTEVAPRRKGSRSAGNVPARNFRCADGVLCVQAGGEANYARLCVALERPDLLADPRFSSRAKRTKNEAALYEILEPIFATRPIAKWLHTLTQHRVYCGPVYDVAQSYADPQVVYRGTRVPMTRAGSPPADGIANPIRFSSMPPMRYTHPPGIGEHTRAILEGELGMSPEEIACMSREGVI